MQETNEEKAPNPSISRENTPELSILLSVAGLFRYSDMCFDYSNDSVGCFRCHRAQFRSYAARLLEKLTVRCRTQVDLRGQQGGTRGRGSQVGGRADVRHGMPVGHRRQPLGQGEDRGEHESGLPGQAADNISQILAALVGEPDAARRPRRIVRCGPRLPGPRAQLFAAPAFIHCLMTSMSAWERNGPPTGICTPTMPARPSSLWTR